MSNRCACPFRIINPILGPQTNRFLLHKQSSKAISCRPSFSGILSELLIASLLSGFFQLAAQLQNGLPLSDRRRLHMTAIQTSLFILFERFPERIELIKALYENNESFKTLCEDYRRCAEALQHWKQSLDEDAPARVLEYENLLRELEAADPFEPA
jgi:hypothetical protein